MQDPLLSRKRRTLIGAAGGAVLLPLLPLLALPARAQAYPNKPIRLVVAFDVWMHYPDVVNPEPRVRTADAE